MTEPDASLPYAETSAFPVLTHDGPGLARASAQVLSASVASLLVGLVRSKVIAVLLGPVGIGALATLNLFLSSASVLASGVAGTGAIRALAAARARGDAQEQNWLERYLFVAPAVVGIGFTVASFLLAAPLARLLLGDPGLWYLIFIVAVAIPVAVLSASYTAWLETLLRIGVIARADILTGIASVPLTALGLLAWGLPGGAAAVGAAFLVRLICLHATGSPGLPRDQWRLALHPPQGQLDRVLRLGATAAVVSTAATLGALVVRAEIVALLGLQSAGLYQPAALFSDTFLDVLLASTSVYLFPRLTGLLAGGHVEAARLELLGGLRIALAVTVPLTLVAIGFSGILLNVLFTSEFQPAAQPLIIQMVGTVPRVIAWSLGLALVPLGRTRAWASIALFAVALRLAGVAALIPSMGLDGAAVAYGIAWTVAALLTVVAVTRKGGFPLRPSDARLSGVAAVLIAAALGVSALGGPVAAFGCAAAMAVWLFITRDALRELVSSLLIRSRPG